MDNKKSKKNQREGVRKVEAWGEKLDARCAAGSGRSREKATSTSAVQ